MANWLSELSLGDVAHKVRHRVLPNLASLPATRMRRCGCCEQLTVILAIGNEDEFKICLRCKANLRYELLATVIRDRFPDLAPCTVLELDPSSPLRSQLSHATRYIRSFYREHISPGTQRADGAVCEDVMRLTLPDASVDLMVSSDVLEHVPDPALAFRETARVLKPGGVHLFTVPPRPATRRRASAEPSGVTHFTEPEYHLDPLDKRGVLVFWDYGPDLPEQFATPGLHFRVAAGPAGSSRRTVWEACRVESGKSRT